MGMKARMKYASVCLLLKGHQPLWRQTQLFKCYITCQPPVILVVALLNLKLGVLYYCFGKTMYWEQLCVIKLTLYLYMP